MVVKNLLEGYLPDSPDDLSTTKFDWACLTWQNWRNSHLRTGTCCNLRSKSETLSNITASVKLLVLWKVLLLYSIHSRSRSNKWRNILNAFLHCERFSSWKKWPQGRKFELWEHLPRQIGKILFHCGSSPSALCDGFWKWIWALLILLFETYRVE